MEGMETLCRDDIGDYVTKHLASGFCIPEPLPVHTGITERQVHPLIRFSTEKPRTSPRQPAMVRSCGMGT